MWTSNNSLDLDDPRLRGRLELYVEKGHPNDDRLKIDLKYRSQTLGYAYVYVEYNDDQD